MAVNYNYNYYVRRRFRRYYERISKLSTLCNYIRGYHWCTSYAFTCTASTSICTACVRRTLYVLRIHLYGISHLYACVRLTYPSYAFICKAYIHLYGVCTTHAFNCTAYSNLYGVLMFLPFIRHLPRFIRLEWYTAIVNYLLIIKDKYIYYMSNTI